VTGTQAPFTGPLVFTPTGHSGTITAQLAGSFDVVTGVFSARSTSVSGVGALHGVTGTLAVLGTENFTTGAFTETLSGTLCVGKGQHCALTQAVAGPS
jgi:hypothetical protein